MGDMGVGISWTWDHILKVPLISHMIDDTFLNLSDPQFPHHELNTHYTELCGEGVRYLPRAGEIVAVVIGIFKKNLSI